MNRIIGIGGCATINGIIFINAGSGKIVRGMKQGNGAETIEELLVFSRIFRFYKDIIEQRITKIPVARELFKVALMIGIAFFSFFTGILRAVSFKYPWSLKKAFLFIITVISIYVFWFFDDFHAMVALLVLAVCYIKELSTLFKYHGAEHKVINMYENTSDISEADVEDAKAFSRIHSRCGTNLLVLMVPAGIAVYAAESYFLKYPDIMLDFAISMLLLVVALEILKALQKRKNNWILKGGMLVQKYITTKEPEEHQLELALKTLKEVL